MRFKLHWLDGETEIIGNATTNTAAEAFNAAGIGNGALKALDWYDEPISEEDYEKEQAEKNIWEVYSRDNKFLLTKNTLPLNKKAAFTYAEALNEQFPEYKCVFVKNTETEERFAV